MRGSNLRLVAAPTASPDQNSRGTGPRPERSAPGDRARLSVGRRNSNWIVLAPDRLGKLGRSGTGAAHGRRTARVSQSRRVRGASREPDSRVALATVWGAHAPR